MTDPSEHVVLVDVLAVRHLRALLPASEFLQIDVYDSTIVDSVPRAGLGERPASLRIILRTIGANFSPLANYESQPEWACRPMRPQKSASLRPAHSLVEAATKEQKWLEIA